MKMPCGHDERELRVKGTKGLVMGAPVTDLHWFCRECDTEALVLAARFLGEVEIRGLVA